MHIVKDEACYGSRELRLSLTDKFGDDGWTMDNTPRGDRLNPDSTG